MGCLRKRSAGEGKSKRASDLIVSSRREDTLSTHSSTWNKWVSWRVEQNIDPVQCNVNWILDILVYLFESGYQYRRVCTHRLAILAFHSNIEGRPVGEHTRVNSLITSVFNNQPPQPKYGSWCWFIWKKNFQPNNNDFSDKLLTFKVAMLLALTSAYRVRGLHIFDPRLFVKTWQKYVFKFHKLHKSWRQSQKPTTLEFAAFLKTRIFVLCQLWMNI